MVPNFKGLVPEFCYLVENSEGQCPADIRGYAAGGHNQQQLFALAAYRDTKDRQQCGHRHFTPKISFHPNPGL